MEEKKLSIWVIWLRNAMVLIYTVLFPIFSLGSSWVILNIISGMVYNHTNGNTATTLEAVLVVGLFFLWLNWILVDAIVYTGKTYWVSPKEYFKDNK